MPILMPQVHLGRQQAASITALTTNKLKVQAVTAAEHTTKQCSQPILAHIQENNTEHQVEKAQIYVKITEI